MESLLEAVETETDLPEGAEPEVEVTPGEGVEAEAADGADAPVEPADGEPNPGTEAEEKAGEESQADEGDKDYESLSLSEESPLNDSHVEGLREYAQEQGLSAEQAQAQLDREEKFYEAVIEHSEQALAAQSQAWLDDVKNDTEYGGDNLPASMAAAKAALSKFATPDFIKEITDEGNPYRNHAGLFRLLAAVGAGMGESQELLGGSSTPSNGRTWGSLFKNSGTAPSI